MRMQLLMWLFIPLIGIGQKPTVISVNRIFPKNDKIVEFEKALKNHVQKYHSGEWKWRVYTIESGPDAGGYHVVEGPSTWDQIDKRGTLGAEHMNDWNKNVMPLTMDKNAIMYATYREELSSVQLTEFSDKIAIQHLFPKPGKVADWENNLALFRKVWENSGQNVVVYEASSSGPARFSIVTRYKDGLKERETDFRKQMKEKFTAIHGEAAWQKWIGSYAENTESQWGELLFFDANLSSK